MVIKHFSDILRIKCFCILQLNPKIGKCKAIHYFWQMEPRITLLTEKKLIGIRSSTSLAADKTADLWKGFMAERKKIQNPIGTTLYSINCYPVNYFSNFNPEISFDKWAAIEVGNFSEMPSSLQQFILPGGLYAVFLHKGTGSDHSIFKYIYTQWLPASKKYALDNRPHFEELGEKYKNNSPDSEEYIWIPIYPK